MRHRVAVLLAALAIVPAACGGGDGRAANQGPPRAAYATAVNRAQEGLARRFAALQRHISPTSTPAQDRRMLASYEAAVGTAARQLRAVSPPAGLRPLHRRLVADVEGYGAVLRSVRTSIDSGDARTVLAAQGRLGAAVARVQQRINATIRAINRKLGA